MNKAMIRYITGRLLQILALVMAIPFLLSIFFQESVDLQLAYLQAMAASVLVGSLLSLKKARRQDYGLREGMVLTALAWLLLSIFGAIPFVASGFIPHWIDAVFETSSGFTTTGASILTDVEALPDSLLFWRSLTHFMGGMGVLVFMLAILPESSPQSLHIMQSEMSGVEGKKLNARVRASARIFYTIYSGMTLCLIFVLKGVGLSWFDACIHAFGAAGTGGFSNYNASVATFNSSLVELVLALAMLLFSINFILYYLLLQGRIRDVIKNQELRAFFMIVVIASLALFVGSGIDPIQALFVVSSTISTTGFGLLDYSTWTLSSHWVILGLMFVGGCGGSTAGGFKVGRVVGLWQMVKSFLRQTQHPGRVSPTVLAEKRMSSNAQQALAAYTLLYGMVFALGLLVVSFDQVSFELAFSSVSATINNVGPALGEAGPAGNFAFFSPLSKVCFSLLMLAGRLEILPFLILFAPTTWTRL